MRWMGRGFFLPPRKRSTARERLRFQRQRGREHRRRQHGLAQHALGRLRAQQPRGAVEREAVLGAEREHDRVVAGGGLELEVEGGAEALAQCQAEAPVDAAAERGVHHHLHAAGLVEEPLEHDVVAGRERAQARPGRSPGTATSCSAASGSSPHACSTWDRASLETRAELRRRIGVGEELAHGAAQRRDLVGELFGPARRLPDPERDGGVRALGVGHPHLALGDAPDPPRVGAEEKDVTHHRLDGEVLVDRAHRRVVGLGDDPVVADLGDGTAARERGQARTAPGAEHAVARRRGARRPCACPARW